MLRNITKLYFREIHSNRVVILSDNNNVGHKFCFSTQSFMIISFYSPKKEDVKDG